jgi:hypothetical protein
VTSGRGCRSASERRGAATGDARTREVRPRHSSKGADEQSRVTGRGAGGAKSRGRGKRGSAKHAPGQDRESVSQALDRVRQAARQRRKEKFTALFHHLSLPMLRTHSSPLSEKPHWAWMD